MAAAGRTVALAGVNEAMGTTVTAIAAAAIVRTSLDMSFPSHRAPAMNHVTAPPGDWAPVDTSRYLGDLLVGMPQSVVWATLKLSPHNEKTPSNEGVFHVRAQP